MLTFLQIETHFLLLHETLRNLAQNNKFENIKNHKFIISDKIKFKKIVDMCKKQNKKHRIVQAESFNNQGWVDVLGKCYNMQICFSCNC